jgi:hypothetical protein
MGVQKSGTYVQDEDKKKYKNTKQKTKKRRNVHGPHQK